MIWTCPVCGSGDIVVDYQQTYAVEEIILNHEKVDSEVGDPVSDPQITHIECQDCGQTDVTDVHWHMDEREWEKELKDRWADWATDVARGT